MKKTETIILSIETLGAGGDGVGTYKGKPVFVAKTAPGDNVQLRLENENADGFQSRLLNVETAAPMRVPAPCPYFQACGGCSLQHVNDDFYRQWKVEKVTHALERAGVEIGVMDTPVFLPAPTRRRTTMAATKGGHVFGYNEVRSHNIIDAKVCLILEPALNAKMQALRPYLPRLMTGQSLIDITVQQVSGAYDMVITGLKTPLKLEQLETLAELAEALDIARISTKEKDFAAPELTFTRHPVIKQFGDLQVRLPPGAFLQASLEGEQALVERVIQYAKGARKVADLFCGCGTFTGAMLQQGVQVHAVDGDADAINALSNSKHKNLSTAKRNLFKDALSSKELSSFDTVIFDPPRAGAKSQVQELAFSSVETIIAVSCNPASFARDAKILQENGYDLKRLSIVDQFVWSSHVELVALFKKA